MKRNPFTDVSNKEITGKKENIGGKIHYSYYHLFNSMNIGVNFKVVAGGEHGRDGTTYFLGVDKKNRAYYLEVFSGCCEHCDPLWSVQDDMEELIDLRDELKKDIIQFESLQEFETWFNGGGQFDEDAMYTVTMDDTDDVDEEEFSDYDAFVKKANKKFKLNLK